MLSTLNTLPVLGLGVSLSLGEEPNPLELFAEEGGPQFIEYSGLCDVQRIFHDIKPLIDTNIPLLFHPSFINFCGSFENSIDWLETAKKHIETVNSPWFAQDCAYCFWGDSFGYSSQFGYFIPPILNQASFDRSLMRVREVQVRLNRFLAIEPPPVSYIVGTMSPIKFFSQLAILSDCGLLFDVGHLYSYQLASGETVEKMLDNCPLERVIELHIAGGMVSEVKGATVYLDAHEHPIMTPVFDLLEVCLPRLTNLKAVCYECEGVGNQIVLSTLSRIRDQVVRFSGNSELVECVKLQSIARF